MNATAADAIGYTSGTSVTTLTVNQGGVFNIATPPAAKTYFNLGNQGYVTNLVLNGGSVTANVFATTGRSAGSTSAPGTASRPSPRAACPPPISSGVQNRAGNALSINTASGTSASSGYDLLISGNVTEAEGTSSIVKSGPGILAVLGSNTYTGGTNIVAGPFGANNPGNDGSVGYLALGTGLTTVGTAGSLGGNGTTGGDVVVAGTITAGPDANTVGSLTTGNQSWNASGGYAVKLGPSGTNDALTMTGLTVNASSGAPFTVRPTNPANTRSGMTYTIAYDSNATGTSAADPFADGDRCQDAGPVDADAEPADRRVSVQAGQRARRERVGPDADRRRGPRAGLGPAAGPGRRPARAGSPWPTVRRMTTRPPAVAGPSRGWPPSPRRRAAVGAGVALRLRARPRPQRITCMNKRHAFTLVELLVVIGIIALLIGILLPVLAKARQQASNVKCLANLHQLSLAYQQYVSGNHTKSVTYEGNTTTAQDPAYVMWQEELRPYYGRRATPGKYEEITRNIRMCPEAPDLVDPTFSLTITNAWGDARHAWNFVAYNAIDS